MDRSLQGSSSDNENIGDAAVFQEHTAHAGVAILSTVVVIHRQARGDDEKPTRPRTLHRAGTHSAISTVHAASGLARSRLNVEPTGSPGTKLRPTETDRGLCSVFGRSHSVLRYFGPVSVFMANFFGRSSGHDVLRSVAPGCARTCSCWRLLGVA
jgi:hypothetical protein